MRRSTALRMGGALFRPRGATLRRNPGRRVSVRSILKIAACLAALAAASEPALAGEITDTPTWGFFAISEEGDPLRDLPAVSWSRITGLYWGKLETPPGSGRYDWDSLDGRVRKAQKNGYNLVFELKTGNDPAVTKAACARAARQSKREPHLKSCPLREEREAAWKRLVEAIIERYDGDGKSDMPGLARGFVLDIQIENEAASTNYWYPDENDGRSAAKAFLPALKLAYEAKLAANPATRIIAPGIIQPNRLARCADGRRRPECAQPYHVRNRDFTEELLRNSQYFDAVDIHFFNYFRYDPSFVPDGIEWVREQMRRTGRERPIYSLEWTGAMMMDVRQGAHGRDFFSDFPFRELRSADAIKPVYQNLAAPRNERYRRWFEVEQAREFPKLFTTMLAHGVERMIHVQFHDYVGQGWNSLWWNWQGIVRYQGTRARPVLVRKPAFYAYQALSRKLAGLTAVGVVSGGQDYFAYQFEFRDRPAVIVAWTESGERVVDLSRKVKGDAVKVTSLLTELDENDRPHPPETENVKATRVRLTGTPALIEAVAGRE
jgi:hypothetical protein